METVPFRISGEFITDLARTWFWDENKPIQIIDELLRNCIQCNNEDTINTIICQILEGRKKFTGINNFALVDDNEHIRPLIQKFTQNERKAGINAIRLDMMTRFIRYVDKWSTVKSMHPEVLCQRNNPTSYAECINYFTTVHNDHTYENEPIIFKTKDGKDIKLFDTPTKGGLWLIDYPNLCYDACSGDLAKIGKNDFWQRIYEYKKDDPDFKERTERYEFDIQTKSSMEERMDAFIKAYDSKQPKEEEPEYLTKEWIDYQWRHTQEYQYNMKPDDKICWEGLIAPNGDFYACGFGCHNEKALCLLIYYAEWFGKTSETIRDDTTLEYDKALDRLVSHGWCATHKIAENHYISYPWTKQITKAQYQCIMDLQEKHNANIDIHVPMIYR